jgi:hypothetical protein
MMPIAGMNERVLKSPELPRPVVVLPTDGLPVPKGPKLRLAAITTAWFKYSHADDIITKFIEGYAVVSRIHEPHCEVAGIYLEQMPATDIGHGMAARHEIPLFDTPAEALTLGGDTLAVDGVLLIGEHGDYEIDERGVKLYPRRRLFEEVLKVFRASGRSAPVFCDKHLSWSWENATWMQAQARELGFPLQAGSSVPLAWRLPPLAFADGVELEDCLSVYYAPDIPDGIDYASYHTLEALQAFVEHRPGGETGVRAVHSLEGEAAWQAADEGLWSPELLAAAIHTVPSVKTDAHAADALRAADPNPVVVLVEYTDGFRAAAYLTRALLHDEFCLAARVAGIAEPVATWFHLNKPQRDHFSFLCNHAEVMFRSGRVSTPLEPTMLVTGILEAAANSRHAGNTRIETLHLQNYTYTPAPERI